jgi:hypothetical protein
VFYKIFHLCIILGRIYTYARPFKLSCILFYSFSLRYCPSPLFPPSVVIATLSRVEPCSDHQPSVGPQTVLSRPQTPNGIPRLTLTIPQGLVVSESNSFRFTHFLSFLHHQMKLYFSIQHRLRSDVMYSGRQVPCSGAHLCLSPRGKIIRSYLEKGCGINLLNAGPIYQITTPTQSNKKTPLSWRMKQ